MSAPDDVAIDELANILHEEVCFMYGCQWRKLLGDSDHKKYYEDKAQTIYGQLEPDIGGSNVSRAVEVILGEMLHTPAEQQ